MKDFPHLTAVCELIDADNGAHHVERIEPGSIEPIEQRMRAAAASVDAITLTAWDTWCGTLDEDEQWRVAAGEEEEQLALVAQCPVAGLNDFLCRFFEA